MSEKTGKHVNASPDLRASDARSFRLPLHRRLALQPRPLLVPTRAESVAIRIHHIQRNLEAARPDSEIQRHSPKNTRALCAPDVVLRYAFYSILHSVGVARPWRLR